MPGTWSEQDDRKLWSTRSKPTAQLATTFGKTNGAIRARLKHLQDPTHKAYTRRVRESSWGAAQSSRSSSSSSVSRSPYFASSIAARSATSGSGGNAKSNLVDLTGASPFAEKSSSSASRAGLTPLSAATAALLRGPSPSQLKQQPQQRIDPSTLNTDQKAASEYILSGGNAFLTGAAGVGKSYLLRYLIQGLRGKYERGGGGMRGAQKQNEVVVVAAATGIAATHINGVTIHSWAGVRLGTGGSRVLVPRVLSNKAACDRWRKAQVLVLDEVSMIDGMLFQALDEIGREVRNCRSKPFGGIQLVLSGDFFQLPPVSLARCGFAFETPAWSTAEVKMVELRTVVRQSGDQSFINILNQVRVGKCPSEVTQALEACHLSRKPLPADGIVPTKLYCTNRNVDEENNRKLAQLPGNERLFEAADDFKGNYNRDVQKNLCQALDKKVPSQLRLKIGAQVILTRNMPDSHLVNGSRGIVKAFEECRGDDKLYPMVHFSNGVKMLVRDESVYQGGASGAMVRTQLPLKLAWCLTVHKSQGMTIERAELQLDDAFDFGQVYVALSRITSLDGLWVRGGRITQSVVKAHPKVIAFYQQNGTALMAKS